MTTHTIYHPSTKTWSSQTVKPLYNPHVSVATVLFKVLSRNPNHIGQINDNNGVQLTNDQLRLNAIRLAINLQRGHLSVRKDDVIGLVAKNSEKVSAVVFAAFALAAPINTLDTNFKCGEIAHMFRLTCPSLVFCDSDAYEQVKAALADLELSSRTSIVTVDRPVDGVYFLDDLLVAHDDEHLFVPTEFEDGTKQTAIIACSSGTTGPSKGVAISHALILHQMSEFVPLKSDDIYLSFSSLYWMTGIMALVASTLSGITRIITTCPFEANLFLNIIERYGVTITLVAPFHLSQLLQSPYMKKTNLSTLRYFMCTGGAIADAHVAHINQLLPVDICNVYGFSELAGAVSTNVAARPRSVGALKNGVQVRVIDANGNQCGPRDDGEVYVKQIHPILGYCGDKVATSDAIDSEGWFKTGDVGHFDDDGYLYLVDRKKDIMKYLGHQISPSELENVVLRCPGVSQVCVVGIYDAALSTDLPAAVVVRDHSVNQEDIEAIVKATLSDAKQLRGGVYFVPELPVTPSGKVLRRKVQEMVMQMRASSIYSL